MFCLSGTQKNILFFYSLGFGTGPYHCDIQIDYKEEMEVNSCFNFWPLTSFESGL